jgi:hypothetical protein
MSDNHGSVDRALALFVYVPIGVGMHTIEAAPGILEALAARGKAEVDRRHEQLVKHAASARSVGQFAWSYGLPKLRARAERKVATAAGTASRVLHLTGPAEPAARPVPRPAESAAAAAPVPPRVEPVVRPTASGAPSVAGNGAHAPAVASGPKVSELPIPGYDALSASQVVERLAGLAHDELDAIAAYEASHRNRRTILGKVEQLSSPSA